MDRTLTFRFFGKDYTASSTMKGLAKEAHDSHIKIAELASTIAKWGQRAVLAVGAVGSTSAYAIAHVGMSFEDSMNHFSAASNATEEQLKRVNEAALRLGNGLKVPGANAQDAMDAMAGLASSGDDVRQSMQSARGVMLLAAMSGMTEAQAADSAAASLREYGYRANEAVKFDDILASASTNAAGSMQGFLAAVRTVGPVARETGVGLKDVATTLVLLGRRGLTGQSAGSALSQMLIKLAPTSKSAADHLKQLGVSAYDSTGHFRGMESVIEQLQAAHKRLSPAQYNTYAGMVFGRYSIKAVNDLVEQGTAGWKKYGEGIGEQGAALEKVKRLHEGLGGTLGDLRDQLTNLGIVVFQKVEPTVNQWLKGFAEKLRSLNLAPKVAQLTTFAMTVASKVVPQLLKLVGSATRVAKGLAPIALPLLKIGGAVVLGGLHALNAVFGFLANHATAVRRMVIVLGAAFLIFRATVISLVAMDALGRLIAILKFLPKLMAENAAKSVRARAAMLLLAGATKVWNVVTLAASKVWALLNLAWETSPIGLIVTAIAALAFGLYELYKHSETARRIMTSAFHIIEMVVGKVVQGIVGYFRIMATVWLTVIGAIVHTAAKALSWLPGPFGDAAKAAAGAFDTLKTNVLGTLDTVYNAAGSWGQATGNAYANGVVNGFGEIDIHSVTGKKIVAAQLAKHQRLDGDVATMTTTATATHKSSGGGGGPAPILTAGGSGLPDLGGGGGGGGSTKAKKVADVFKGISRAQGRELAKALFDGFHGGALKLLHKLPQSMQDMMTRMATQISKAMAKMAAKIKAARTHLANDLKAKADEAKGFRDALLPDITGAFFQDPAGNTMLGSIGGFLSGQLTTLKTFFTDIGLLRKMGLSPALLRMIVNAGPVQGDQLAQQLISGQTSVATANALQSQISTTAGAIGNIVAGADYDKKIAHDRKVLHDQLAEQRKQTRLLHALIEAVLGTAMTPEQLQKALLRLKRHLGHDLGIA